MQISNVIGVYLISMSVGQEIPIYIMMLIVPTIGILLSIPISFVGLESENYHTLLPRLYKCNKRNFIYNWYLYWNNSFFYEYITFCML